MPDQSKLPLFFVPYNAMDASKQFALETFLLGEVAENPAVYFLFWQTEPTVMVGRYQNVYAEVNLKFIQSHGIHLIRRPSGGGTIFTDRGGWQFSFIQPDRERIIDFSQFMAPVVQALDKLGIQAERNGRNDITYQGKKFSGNAQYRKKGAVVHHGSLLFDTDFDQMLRATTPPEYKLEGKGISSFRDRVCNLREALPPERADLTNDQFGEEMVAWLGGGKGIRSQVQERCLTSKEQRIVEELANSIFQNPAYTWGENPPFTYRREGHFSGGHVCLQAQVEKGVVQQAKLTGDFFGTLEEEDFNRLLTGLAFERKTIGDALLKAGMDQMLYRISLEELISLLP